MIIKGVDAKTILDSRKEKTIQVSIKTSAGNFSASSPSGKSKGKYEAKYYRKSLEEDIKTIKKFRDYFSEEILEEFNDLKRVEDILEGHVGSNTLFAFESAILKAIASKKFKTSHSSSKNVERKEKKEDIWKLINEDAKSFPRLVGNCIGGGKHSKPISGKRPDFQEFLLIPNEKSVKKSLEINQKAKKEVEMLLRETDKTFKNEKNDEDAWMVSLNEKEILDILKKIELPLGADIASSEMYKRKNYCYENPLLKRTPEEQLSYLLNLIKNFSLFYIEDPFEENDFESFAKLLKQCPNSLIVGDDLTVTNPKRFEKAIEKKSINAIIVKPNQIGSLMAVKKVCEMAKKNNIKIVFSHRSGETGETILADLAFGFQADFFKCGITGREREVKIKRLIEIENSLKN
jgi:enolase